MDINNPTANLNLNDQSKTDDFIKQEGVTIHADNGADREGYLWQFDGDMKDDGRRKIRKAE